jgi:hypothetical protein
MNMVQKNSFCVTTPLFPYNISDVQSYFHCFHSARRVEFHSKHSKSYLELINVDNFALRCTCTLTFLIFKPI